MQLGCIRKKGKYLLIHNCIILDNIQKKLSQYAYWPKSDITSLEMGQFDTVVEELYKIK